MLSLLNPNIIKSIFQSNINKYMRNYPHSYLYDTDFRLNLFMDSDKVLNIIDITKLYSIMINIKRHKYITDESIIITINIIEMYDADNMSDDEDTFEYKKNIKYYSKYPSPENEIENNRQYDTKNVLLYINNGKYLNLANCCNYF